MRAAAAALASLAGAALFAALPAAAARHVVVISIDGLRPAVYRDPASLEIRMPNLVELRDTGVSAARMLPVFPSVTYPAHTTLVTGARPAEHGIVSNFKSGQDWYLDSKDIAAQTLWAAAEAAGLTTALVTWPASYGAAVDFLVPEDLTFGATDLAARLRAGSTPGLFDDLAAKCGPIELPGFEAPEAGAVLDRMTSCFAAALIREERPNLLLVHFLDADHRQHFAGPDSPEARHAFELIDGFVGELRAAARDGGIEDETVFVIVGDHGFAPVHTNLNLAALLLGAGFARIGESAGIELDPGIRVAALGGSAALYLDDPKDQALAQRLERSLQAEVDRRYGGLLQLLPRRELDRLGAFPGAALGFAASEGYMLVSLGRSEAALPTGSLKGMHGYLPSMPAMATGFIAAGRGLRRGVELPLVRQLDVAPTLAQLLGLALEHAAGLPIPGVFETRAPGPGIGIAGERN